MIINTHYTVNSENLKKSEALKYVAGNLSIQVDDARLPALIGVGANLSVCGGNNARFPNLKRVNGGLFIHNQGASLPSLTSVGGSVEIQTCEASLPMLHDIRGALEIRAIRQTLPSLKLIGKWLTIQSEHAELPSLLRVEENVKILANFARLGSLGMIGGSLKVIADNTYLPLLLNVDGDVEVKTIAAHLTSLGTIGGNLEVDAITADLSSLKVVKREMFFGDAKLIPLPDLLSVGGVMWEQPTKADQIERLKQVAKSALESEFSLNTERWVYNQEIQTVEGWAIVHAEKQGDILETAMGEQAAGAYLLGLDLAHNFSLSTDEAREWLAGYLDNENTNTEHFKEEKEKR